MYAITPISESGKVHAGLGLNETCIPAGDLITRSSGVPVPRSRITDWPLKMPNAGAVTIVVTPMPRRASMSSSVRLTLCIPT